MIGKRHLLGQAPPELNPGYNPIVTIPGFFQDMLGIFPGYVTMVTPHCGTDYTHCLTSQTVVENTLDSCELVFICSTETYF